MSSVAATQPVQPYAIWARQIRALVRMDLPYHFLTTRSIWLYLLALAPVGISGIYTAVQTIKGPFGSLGGDVISFAGTFQILFVRFLIFFGCLAVGTFLVRGEILNKTLHFYLLLPVRREVFYLSRFVVGLLATSIVFMVSVTATYFLMLAHRGTQFWTFFWQGQGLANLLDYLLVTVLACMGYGALFLLASLYVRNPLIPGAVFFVWEAINVFLPVPLQRISVIYYLKALSPVDVPAEKFLALLMVPPDPISRGVAVAGLVVLSAAMVAIGAYRIRSAQVDYGE